MEIRTINDVNVEIHNNYEEMSAAAAELNQNVITREKNPVLGLATGSTPN